MLEKLIDIFIKFPGIGPRQAKRFAYFLAGQNAKFIKNFSDLLLEIKKEIKQCPSCFRFFSGNQCEICTSVGRDKNILMIVEKDVDLENIEKSGIYNGKYFVLNGTLSLTNNHVDKLRFKELFEKVKKEQPQEIIIALSVNPEGENTALYIIKILEPLSKKITRLGRGLSTGTELEYSDKDTIDNAFKNRH
ncbi:recombination mediator RecR [Patescibacteria group bacterium]|nr:recombination mediator RecR [Patescibacteria group bacterium]